MSVHQENLTSREYDSQKLQWRFKSKISMTNTMIHFGSFSVNLSVLTRMWFCLFMFCFFQIPYYGLYLALPVLIHFGCDVAIPIAKHFPPEV